MSSNPMSKARASCGVIPTPVFLDPQALYLIRRLVRASISFLQAALDKFETGYEGAPRETWYPTFVQALQSSIPSWSPKTIQQRVDRIRSIASDFENALRRTFVRYAAITYGRDNLGFPQKVRASFPRTGDFVFHFFNHLVSTSEVQTGIFFDRDTCYRNYATSCAILDAFHELCHDNVDVSPMDKEKEASSMPKAHSPRRVDRSGGPMQTVLPSARYEEREPEPPKRSPPASPSSPRATPRVPEASRSEHRPLSKVSSRSGKSRRTRPNTERSRTSSKSGDGEDDVEEETRKKSFVQNVLGKFVREN